MKFHPACNIFPMMSEQEFSGLVADIQKNGQTEPILLNDDGLIIDGRNRYKACEQLGVKVDTRTVHTNGSLINLVVSMNLHRRHLDSSQRAAVGLDLEEWLAKEARRGRPPKIGEKVEKVPPFIGKARNEAARLVGTNGHYITDLKAAVAKAPELKEEVKAGRLKVKEARVLSEMPESRRAAVVEKVKSGTNFKEAKRQVVREAKTPPVTALPESCVLLSGDLLAASQSIEENSVDCIITDPPYGKDHLKCYQSLAGVATRVLRPGGSLLVMTGQSYLPDVVALLRLGNCTRSLSGLLYQWTIAYLTPGGQSAQVWNRKVNTFWKPVLWYVKGTYEGDWVGDVAKSATNDNDKRFHDWGQSESGMADLIERFTYPGQTILDPFLGGGTTGVVALKLARKFIGIDVDDKAILAAKARLCQ